MFGLTFQVVGVGESLDVSNLVQRPIIPPVGVGQIFAARGLQDDEDGPHQHPQPAEPEHHQQRPAGPHPAEKQEKAGLSMSRGSASCRNPNVILWTTEVNLETHHGYEC